MQKFLDLERGTVFQGKLNNLHWIFGKKVAGAVDVGVNRKNSAEETLTAGPSRSEIRTICTAPSKKV